MTAGNDAGQIILVLDDVEETRDGIQMLLEADGYRIFPARGEDEAVAIARRESPNLMLVSLAGSEAGVIVTAERVRQRAGLSDAFPITRCRAIYFT